MKDYLKNLFAARGAAFWLNLLGLSLAFVIFYVLMAEVKWVHGFDKFHDGAERICRVDFYEPEMGKYLRSFNTQTCEELSHTFADLLESSAFIIYGNNGPSLYHIVDGDSTAEKESVLAPIFLTSKGMPKVFTFDMIEGNIEDYETPNADFFPLSLCKKIFGEKGPYVGRTFSFKGSGNYSHKVSGVYRDFPSNSRMENCIYHSMEDFEFERERKNTSDWTTALYVKVREGLPVDSAAAQMSRMMQKNNLDFTFYLPTLHELYFMPMYKDGMQGSHYMTMIYLLIACLVVVIAAVNYMNFEISLIPYYIKEINVRRIFGARAWPLRWRRLRHSFFTIALALVLSFVLISIINRQDWLAEYLHADLAFDRNLLIIGVMGILTLMILVVSGGYPAWYSTSRKPALVINGNFALSPSGRALRRTLVGVQFAVSMTIIIFTLLMTSQTHFMYNSPVGYARDSIIYMQVDTDLRTNYEAPITEKLKACPDVKDFSWCQFRLGEPSALGFGHPYKGKNIFFAAYPVKANFLSTMGIRVTEGRDFRPEDASSKHGAIIFNEEARQAYGLELHTTIKTETGEAEIIGFVKGVNTITFHQKMGPVGFYVQGTDNWGVSNEVNCAIRLVSPDRAAKVSRMLADFENELRGSHVMKFYTGDDVADIAYAVENKQFTMVLTGSIISLVISLIGIFGLVLFETRAKRKEIGIRKVFGATTRGILVMFNMQYLRILAVCFLFAAPVAHSLYMRWIESFAYRTPMHWWLFAVAFLIVALVVCLTVTVQSWRAAKERPVETIMK
ncbi:MAG: FtsX-like permease family protein [Bacteroidaceae bacterium]|nr:FtsX-like permease family protein [Bacteroidaceae bacterium]